VNLIFFQDVTQGRLSIYSRDGAAIVRDMPVQADDCQVITLGTSGLKPGIYMLVVTTDKKSYSQKETIP
jgi:hypothetical protein